MKPLSYVLFAAILFSTTFYSAHAQVNSHSGELVGNYITISASGEAVVPADIAYLTINIGVSNPDAERAFELHKERESFLANLLTEMDFEDENISYEPISIRPDRQRDGAIHTATNQRIRLELENFEQLSELQIELISNEFDNFSGSLASSQIERANRRALRQAIANARADAELLAEAAGKTIDQVLWIEHSSDRGYRPPVAFESAQLRTADYGPSLGDFSQTITVQKNIQIRFLMSENGY
jgi:uncharacterized protein YggE